MIEPKYQPTDDEPRLVPDAVWIPCVRVAGTTTEVDSQAEAEAEVQRVALAIADRVHGAELAALRTEVEWLRAEVERLDAERAR